MRRWSKVRAVATFELLGAIKNKGWLITTFGMPVFLMAYGGIVSVPIYFESKQEKKVAVWGLVDQAGAVGLTGDLADPGLEIPAEIKTALEATGQSAVLDQALAWQGNVVFRPFADDASARAATLGGSLRGYFVIPADWVQTGKITQVTPKKSGLRAGEVRQSLSKLLLDRMIQGHVPVDMAERVRKPIVDSERLTLLPTGELEKIGIANLVFRFVVPLVFAVLMMIALLMSSGALVAATAVEKENKVVEVLLASADADEIMLGKLLGLGTAGAIQTLVWFGMVGVAGIIFTASLAAFGLKIPWAGVLACMAMFPLAYLFYGSLMMGTGSIGAQQREANQWGMFWVLPLIVPVICLQFLITAPNGTLAKVLTWIPFTTPLTLVLRIAMEPEGLAWWEVAGAYLLLIVSAWVAVKLSARLFRVGLLLTGARPKIRQIWRQARLS